MVSISNCCSTLEIIMNRALIILITLATSGCLSTERMTDEKVVGKYSYKFDAVIGVGKYLELRQNGTFISIETTDLGSLTSYGNWVKEDNQITLNRVSSFLLN